MLVTLQMITPFKLFTNYLALRLPCPMSSYTWSREHIVPRSLFPRVVTENPDNIIPMPTKLNNARGNRKYTNRWEDGYMVYACKSCPYPGFCAGAGVISPEGFMPPDNLKGPIARSVLKSIEKFPKLAAKINNEVLDYDTAIQWDRQFPMTAVEHAYRNN